MATIAAGLFAASLAVRLLFIHATPDAGWGYSTAFKGDTPLWLDYAQALQAGRPFELGLPIHPPGAAYLAAAVWSGDASGLPVARGVWAILGALTVVATWLAARRSFSPAVAALAASLTALSTGLIVLSGSVDAEAPYLLLAMTALGLTPRVRQRAGALPLAAWAGLNALACLFRVEHLLAFGLLTGWLMRQWKRDGIAPKAGWARGITLILGFALPLLPWQLRAWAAIERFNDELPAEPAAAAAARARVEAATLGVVWDESAQRRRDELPAFARRAAAAFVAATVAHRGGSRVSSADFLLLEEAFGYVPQPLARFPFVSCYGPLNFALANHPQAGAGFSRAALEERPLLTGGAARYPPDLIRGLPPPDLSFVYPPHLRLVNDGYAVGARFLLESPASFLRQVGRKLRIFWSGAALGLTGFNLPLGASGLRRAVDLTVPAPGRLEAAWATLVAVVAGLGLAAAWRQPAAWPWVLYFVSKLPATSLFFGYARLGALVIPVVAVLLALAAERFFTRAWVREWALPFCAALLLGGVALELLRWQLGPQLRLDGVQVESVDPFPRDLQRDQRVDVRLRQHER